MLVTVFLPGSLLTAAVLLLLPAQPAPSVAKLPDDSTRYVIVPLRLAASLPVGVTAFVLAGYVAYRRRRPAGGRRARASSLVLHGLVLGALAVSWWIPNRLFRSAVVEDRHVRIQGVPLQAVVPREEIARVEIGRQPSTNRRGNTCIVLSVEVYETSGDVHRSSYYCYEEQSYRHRELERVMLALKRDLERRPRP